VDLLYNSGIIGAGLFYGMFLSLAWRLLQSRDRSSNVVRAIVFGGLVCYLSVSLSGTMHYNPFLAVFMAVSTALLSRPRLRNSRDRVAAEPAQP
jgi:O-antigen ligase